MTIRPPFANYHRVELERLVQEGFDEIEEEAARLLETPGMWNPVAGVMNCFRFQVLMAAYVYLQSTKGQADAKHE